MNSKDVNQSNVPNELDTELSEDTLDVVSGGGIRDLVEKLKDFFDL